MCPTPGAFATGDWTPALAGWTYWTTSGRDDVPGKRQKNKSRRGSGMSNPRGLTQGSNPAAHAADGQRFREIQQLEKLIESTGIKYTSVATRTLGVSGRAFLEALIGGVADPVVLAGLARGRLRAKDEQLRLAFQGNFTRYHGAIARLHLNRIDQLNAHSESLTGLIDTLMTRNGLDWARELVATIPRIGATGAENILAETSVEMAAFETPAHLASWAGICTGHHESAGKSRSRRTRPGNAHLKGTLGIAAMAATRTNGSFFQNRYRRIASRRGPMRALVAIQHSLIIAIWHILTNVQPYRAHTAA